MKTYTKRALSWVLALALMITCTITGLVLPATAEPAAPIVVYSEDFQDADHGWTWNGAATEAVADGESNKAVAMTGAAKYLRSPKFDVTLKAGERYLLRLKLKATSAADVQDKIMLFFYNTTATNADSQSCTLSVKSGTTYTSNYYTIPTTEYMYIQNIFTVQKDAEELMVGAYSVGGNFTALVDDVQVIKVTNETNLAPGGDFEDARSMWFADYYSNKGAVVVDDGGNKALQINATGVTYIRMNGTQNKKVLEVTFRYKGKFASQPYYAGCGKQEIKKVSTSASTEWREYKALINTANGNVGYIGLYPSVGLLIDDVCVRFVDATLPETEDVVAGNTVTLTPVVAPADVCTTPTMTWESSDTAIATVADGVVTGVAAGTATISLKDSKGNVMSSCAVTVKDPSAAPALTGIVLNKTTATVEEEKTLTLTATPAPEGASLAGLTWETSDAAIATVEGGVVTAVAPGEVTITAKVGDVKATCAVTVEPKNLLENGDFEQGASVNWGNNTRVQEGIGKDGSWGYYTERAEGAGEWDASSGMYYKGSFVSLLEPKTVYTLSFDYKNVGGGTGRPELFFVVGVGTTDTDKKLEASTSYALAAGDTDWTKHTLTFTTFDTLSPSKGWELNIRSLGSQGTTYYDNFKLVKVGAAAAPEEPKLNAIVLDKTTAEIEAESTVSLNVTADPADADISELVWETSDASVATVANGVVTGVAAGTATITAKVGDITATCTVTVTAKATRPQTPTDPNAFIVNGDFEADANIGWKNNAAIQAGVGKDGSWGAAWDYTHDGNGNKTLTLTYDGTNLANLKPNTKYTLSFDYKSTGAGFAQLYSYYAFGADAFNSLGYNKTLSDTEEWKTYSITFTTAAAFPSSNNWGAAFYFRYIMYGNASGTGRGTAAFDNIKLVEIPVATGIALDKETASVKEGKTFALSVSTTPAVATLPEITWTTSDAAVATVDAQGVVTGVAAGTATITATAGSLVDTCVVTVVADDGNLFENGDFEQGANVAWGGVAQILPGVGKDGSIGVKIESKVDENTTSHQQPGFYYKDELVGKLEADAVYELSFDYKHEGKGFGMIYLNKDFGTIESNGKDFYQGQSLTSGNVEWKTVTYTFFTPSAALSANKGAEFLLRQVQYNQAGNEGTGVTYFDNFKLVKVRDVLHADSITLAPSELELLPGTTGTVKVMTTPDGAATGILTFESSDPTIATVDKNGKVTPVANEGEVTITVTNDKGKTATAKVTITPYGNLIKNGDFEQGGEHWGNHANVQNGIGRDGGWGLKMTGSNKAIYYKTSFANLIKPATTYVLTFDYLKPSGADFRVWTGEGFGLTADPAKGTNASEWKTVTKIFTTGPNLTLNSGWDFCFVSDKEGTYSPAVIDNVTLRLYDSPDAVEKLSLSKTELTLIPGRTGSLTLYAEPSTGNLNGTVWTSSDDNVATVAYGVVTAVGKGTATITATTKNSKTATCAVTVSGDDTYIKNGTFDIAGDTSWQLKDGAEIVAGSGYLETNGVQVSKGMSLEYAVSNLRPGTTYQFSVKSRTSSGALNIKLVNGETVLLSDKTGTSSNWATKTVEFTTPTENFDGTAVLTLAPAGNGPVYVDNVRLNVKASLIDFVVSDLFWMGGGYQVTPGTELQFGVTVTNQGEDPVKKGEIVVVELRKNGTPFMTLQQELTEALESGDSVIFASEDKWAADAGHWVVSARANPTLSILEMVDTNNTTQKNLRVDTKILEAPKPALDADMTDLTFSDEFNSLDSIDQYATGADGYKWYVTRAYGAGTVQPDYYSIEDGIISLKAKVPGFNITLSTVDVNTHVGYWWNLGYLEVRFRIPNADPGTSGVDYKGSPAIWSFPINKWFELPGQNKQWVEMDWMEYWGVTSDRPGGYYTITFHDESETEDDKHWFSNGNAYKEGLGDEEWHTMGWLWAENAVITYMDGEEIFHLYYGPDRRPSCSMYTHDSVNMDLEGAYTLMNEQFDCLYIGGSEKFPMEVDYVHIWQGGNGVIDIPEEGEDGEEGGDTPTIDVDAGDFWYYYCTDDYGDNIVEVTEENYYIILEAVEVWPYLSATRKAEINALLAANGQPTFDELLAAAQAIANGEQPGGNESPDTGATTALPIAMAAVVVISGAAMMVSRKRKVRG